MAAIPLPVPMLDDDGYEYYITGGCATSLSTGMVITINSANCTPYTATISSCVAATSLHVRWQHRHPGTRRWVVRPPWVRIPWPELRVHAAIKKVRKPIRRLGRPGLTYKQKRRNYLTRKK